jgi:hypothetical protein
VAPTEVSVLAQTSEPTVTLITCSPPGTAWKRLVVSAKQISPSPAATTVAQQPTTGDSLASLPGNAPSWWSQVKAGVGAVFGR